MNNSNTAKLDPIRKVLKRHYGSMEEVRKRSAAINGGKPFVREYVYMVLKGERRNDDLLALAAEVAKELVAKERQINQAIDQAIAAIA
jgi:hypothetical protein